MRSASESTYARDVGIDAGVDTQPADGDALLALQLGHRLVEELDIELEADGGHVSRLLRSQQLPRAADFEVAHGDGEAGAELGVVGERREPRAGLRGQFARVGIEEVCVRGRVERPTRPRIWYSWLRPSMSERSTMSVFACGMSIPDSMIVVETSTSASPRRKACIRSSSSFSFICPCATRKRSFGQSCCSDAARSSIVSTRLWRKNAWPFALRLALERELHELLVVLADRRPDRAASLRRRLDDRDVAHARERQVQRTRDRRRAQREHVRPRGAAT
jgi:hypothetical protein